MGQAFPELGSEGPSSLANREPWLHPSHGKQGFRSIVMCDINLLREVSVQTVNVLVNLPALKPTNPFRGRLEAQGGSVKVKKRIGSAEIVQFGDRSFTVVSFEPENEGDAKKIQTALRPLCEFALSSRLIWLPQVFGVGLSTTPTLIYHDELVCAQDIVKQYQRLPIVFQYLLYRINTSYDAIVDEGTLQKLSIRFSEEIRDWIFNLRTRSFQYDITSNAHSAKCNPPMYFRNRVHPLPPSCNPELKPREILRVVPEYLHLISDLACTTYVEHTADFVRHGVLTFGAVVERRSPGILGHFPSTPPPQWYWENHSPEIDVRCSQSVPSLVDLTYTKKTDIQMDMHFSLRLKPKDRQRLRTAYLSQSFPLHGHVAKSNQLIFVDEFCFSLVGTLTSDPSTSHTPKYLHVPPLHPERINDMPCLSLTSSMELFYWSFDRNGQEKIPQVDWAKYGLDKLKAEMWIGSFWGSQQPYFAVWDYLRLMNYGHHDGERFAHEHGHPILIKDDPHAWIRECGTEQTCSISRSRNARDQTSKIEERHDVSSWKRWSKKAHVERKERKKMSTTSLVHNSVAPVGSEKLPISSRFQITIISTPFI